MKTLLSPSLPQFSGPVSVSPPVWARRLAAWLFLILFAAAGPQARAAEVGWGAALVNQVARWFEGVGAMDEAESDAWAEILATLETARTRSSDALLQSSVGVSQGPAALYQHHVLMRGYAERRVEIHALIERIKTCLITDGADAPVLLARLRAALAEMERRETHFLEVGCTKNPILVSLATSAVCAAIEAGISAAVESWQAMKMEQRRLLLDQLEAKKWDSAAEVLRPGGNRPTLGRPAF